MQLPTIEGVIRRRILVNFRLDPQAIQPLLPSRFRPKLYEGQAIAGICLIRLEHIRPRMMPEVIGISSENAAHRTAVLWNDENGKTREGVYIPRRDTNSQLNHFLGGRLFPGEHHLADFRVEESGSSIDLSLRSRDGTVAVDVKGSIAESLPSSSIFTSLAEASSFFESGSLGYSARRDSEKLDAIELHTEKWRVEPLTVEKVHSSYFEDERNFPRGSVIFDHALIMKDVAHEWRRAS